MENLNKITLRNANIDMLRALFASSLKCDGKLSFSLNDQRIRTDAGNSSFVSRRHSMYLTFANIMSLHSKMSQSRRSFTMARNSTIEYLLHLAHLQ